MGTNDTVLVNNCRETFTPTVSGAIGTCLWEVARAAEADGHEPLVLTRPLDAEPYPWPHLQFLDPAPARLPGRAEDAWRRLTGWEQVRRSWARSVVTALAAAPPRVVVCNNDPELAVVLAERFPKTQVVHWFHNLELVRDRWHRAYMSAPIRSVAVSTYLARAVERAFTLETGRVAVAHNGVDADRFRPADTPAPERVVLGFLGRVAPEKAPDVFLRAALLLAEQGHDFAIQLLGDTNWNGNDGGPYGKLVHRLVDEVTDAGVPVHAPGHVARDDVPAALHRAQIHVVPSGWDEPFGLTTLEGMASGLAVVATATGGTPEVVGNAGLLVPRDEPGAMAEALASLITDPTRLAQARTAARQRAETFTWGHTWRSLMETT